MKIKKVLATALLASAITGCSKPKLTPVTWADVARSIPADVEYVASVRVASDVDTLVRKAVSPGADDVVRLVDEGLGLCTKKPTHVVVVGTSDATFVTWPLPNPSMVADNVEKWTKATLRDNNDARIRSVGNASIVVSTTQAWVVNSPKGAEQVAALLRDADKANASTSVPLKNCIEVDGDGLKAVVPFHDRYFDLDATRREDGLRIAVAALDKSGSQVDLMSHLATFKAGRLDSLAAVAPFAAVAVKKGELPDMLTDIVKYISSTKAKLAVRALAPIFAKADGAVVATLDDSDLRLNITFATARDATAALRKLSDMAARYGAAADFATNGKVLTVTTVSPGYISGLVMGVPVPDAKITKNTTAVAAFARFVIDDGLSVDLSLGLGTSSGTLDILYPSDAQNTDLIIEFVKSLIPNKI